MDAVLGPKIVVLVHASLKVGVVIEEVVRAVGDEQAQRDDEPGEKVEMAIAPGQQPGDDTRIDGHHGDGRTGGNQPFGNDVKRVPLFLAVQFDQGPQRGLPHRKVDLHWFSPLG